MADNTQLPATGTGTADIKVATDKVTYSGDADQNVQLMKPVVVSGVEGSKTVADPVGAGTAAGAFRVTLASDDPAVATLGATSGAAVITDATGTIQQYLRGLVKLAITSGSWLTNITQWGSTAVVTGGVNGSVGIGGNVAHDSATASNPIMRGSRTIAFGTNPTAVAAGRSSDNYASRAGVPFTLGGHPNIVTIKHTTITTAVTDAAIVTISTGLKIVVTRISVTLDNASTVFPTVLIGFATANTPTTTGVLYAHGGFPAGGGMTVGDGSGIVGVGADNEDLRITTTGNATGNGLQVVVSYHTIES